MSRGVGAIKDLAELANEQTTLGYDRRDERAKRQAAEMLHYPY